MPRRSSPVFFLSIVLLAPTVAFCDTVNVGLISFDLFIPGDINTPGVNVFNIYNLTGGFALPPDFAAVDSLTFLSSSLTLINGGTPLVIPLGDLGPEHWTRPTRCNSRTHPYLVGPSSPPP